jgi:TRAP transporter TAXI family solute receptor
VALAALALGGVAYAEMKGMIIGSGSVGADFFAFGSAMQQVLAAKYPDLTFENTATSGSVENVRLLHSGEVDAAIFQVSAATAGALDGTGRFEGEEPYDDIRAIGTLFDFKYSIIVPAQSDIQTIEDLKGKTIAIGPDPATQDVHAAPLFEAHGIDYENDLDRSYASYADLYRQVGEGRFDAAMGYTSGFVPLPAIMELASSTDIRWIGWDADKLRAAGIVPVPVPANTLEGQTEEFVAAQRGLNILAATTDLTDEQAYELAKALHTGIADLAELVPALRANLVDETTLAQPVAPFQYHPGAEKYWREVGLMK